MKENPNSIEKIIKNIMETATDNIQIIISYTTKKNTKKYNLNRTTEDITKVFLPQELKKEINIENIIAQNCSKEILNFAKILIENFPKENLTNFFNNIKYLKVKTSSLFFNNKGVYDCEKNKVIVSEKYADVVIYHELLHMASCIKIGNEFFFGFKKPNIGEGLNEGYTELLARRYFNADNGTYQVQVIFAEKLEQIIGKEKMEQLYLNANLDGLINELKQYATIEEIEQFLINMDYTIKLETSKLNEKEQMRTCIKNINKFLIKCYTKKRINEINSTRELEYLEYKEKMMNFINEFAEYIIKLPQIIKKGEINLKIIDEETFQEYINIGSDIIGFKIPIEINSKKQK